MSYYSSILCERTNKRLFIIIYFYYYIKFGSGSIIWAQFGSGSRVVNNFEKKKKNFYPKHLSLTNYKKNSGTGSTILQSFMQDIEWDARARSPGAGKEEEVDPQPGLLSYPLHQLFLLLSLTSSSSASTQHIHHHAVHVVLLQQKQHDVQDPDPHENDPDLLF